MTVYRLLWRSTIQYWLLFLIDLGDKTLNGRKYRWQSQLGSIGNRTVCQSFPLLSIGAGLCRFSWFVCEKRYCLLYFEYRIFGTKKSHRRLHWEQLKKLWKALQIFVILIQWRRCYLPIEGYEVDLENKDYISQLKKRMESRLDFILAQKEANEGYNALPEETSLLIQHLIMELETLQQN